MEYRSPDWRVAAAREPGLRIGRGTVVGASSAVLGGTGHVMAGGALPPAMVALSSAMLIVLGIAVAGRELRPATILAVLAAGQAAAHVLLSGRIGGGHATHTAGHAVDAALPAPDVAVSAPSVAMVGAHLGAALAVAALLRWGERTVWRLVGLFRSAVGLWLPPLGPTAGRCPSLVAWDDAVACTTSRIQDSLPRRGPPALVR